jgi:hypothetical protein
MRLRIITDEVDIELQKFDATELKRLLDQLSEHKRAKDDLRPKLEEWLIEQKKLPFETVLKAIVQLSRWCNSTGPSYERYSPTAAKISILLFGKELPALNAK